MATSLEKLRRTLDGILAEAAADLDAQAAARAAEVAHALEHHTPGAVDAAVRDALEGQRQWFLALIDERLSYLGERCTTATVLHHLRQQITNE